MSIENEINTPQEEQVTNQDESTVTPEEQQNQETPSDAQEESTDQETTAQTEDTSSEEVEAPATEEVEEASNEEAAEEVAASEEAPAEETSAEEEADSTPEVQEEEVNTQEEPEATPEEAPEAEAVVEENQEEASEEAPAEEAAAEEVPEKMPLDPELQKLADQIDEVLSNKDTHLLEAVTAQDLTRMLLYYGQEEDITSLFPKVGLIKRSFDAIKDKEEIAEEDSQAFDTALEAFNKRKTDLQQQDKVSRAQNSERKKELIIKLQELVGAEDPVRMQQDVRDLQDKWKMVGTALNDDEETLNKQCRSLLDQFYKQRDMHYELLDYDRKINLQEKEKLIVEASQLIPAEDERHDAIIWKQKMDMFTAIQQKWRSIGHVPRDEMDRINNAYREAIDKFFEIREDFKKLQDKIREENAEKKEEILKHMEQFKAFTADKPKAWNDATRELRTYQEAWKQIGQAATRKNNELWSRYREICDAFFTNKSGYFKQFDDLRSENLEKKKELCEKAEDLKNSSEWEKSARSLKQLQKDWKSIGPVPERHSNKLWNRFRTACDTFFEARRKHYESLHAVEYDNLSAKKTLIEDVKNINVEELGSIDAAIQKVKESQAKWKDIGKVPYKEKDNIWNEFRSTIDAFFDGLSMKREEMRDMKLKATLDVIHDPDKRTKTIKSKIVRLRRKIQQGQEKVDQYSNNILFISKGKAGDPLRNQIQKEIDKEKELIVEWRKRIKELNELTKNPPKVEEPKAEEAPATETTAEAPAAEEAIEAPVEEAAAKEEAPAEVETAAEEATEAPAEEVAEKEEAPAEEAPAAEEAAEATPEAPTEEPESPPAEEETPPSSEDEESK